MRQIFLVLISLCILNAQMSRDGNAVYDDATGLMWQDNKDVAIIKLDWFEAQLYCSYMDFNAHVGWRLPTVKELQSIVDVSKFAPAVKEGFQNIASGNYWSSSVLASYSSEIWYVNFYDGTTGGYFQTTEHNVRCVRNATKQ